MLYCTSDQFDGDLLDRRIELQKDTFSVIDEYDKIYFLRQYLKSFEVATRLYHKAKKFTMSKN